LKSRSGTDAEGPLSSPKGQVSESDAQGLRALAEEISREFAPRLEQTALVLYDRDPEHLQAQWHVTTQALAEARDLFPGDGADLRQVLRLCRLDQDGRAEVIASTPQGAGASREAGQNDFALHGDGTEYVCELSLESDAGGWLLLARSNRIRPGPRIAPAPDAGQARHAGDGMARGPDGFEVEAALAAVGGPLHPVFPNLEPDAPPPGHPAPLGEALDQTRPRDLGLFMPDVSGDSAPHRELDDAPPPGHSASLEETLSRTRPGDLGLFMPDALGDSVPPTGLAVAGRPLHPVFPNLEPDVLPPGHSTPLEETPSQTRPRDLGLFMPDVSGDSTPHREPDDAPPPEHPAPLEETPGQTRPRDLGLFMPDALGDSAPPAAVAGVGRPLHPVFPNLAPDASPPGHPASSEEAPSQTRSGGLGLFMPDVSGDSTSPAALAVVGRPLHPVFPNLAPDASPPGHSAFLAEALGRARPGDRGLEFPPGVLWEPATDASLDAEIMAMPPPLIPSSPGLGTSTADMPGPLYDPRGALSSAVLGGVRPSPSN